MLLGPHRRRSGSGGTLPQGSRAHAECTSRILARRVRRPRSRWPTRSADRHTDMARTAAVLLASWIAAGAARAQDAQPPGDLRERRWYGWQVMLADAASVGLIYAGAKGDNGTLVALGVAGALTLPPLIHLAHGSQGDALKSFAVRAAPFGLSLAIFAATEPDCGEGCGE